MKVAFFLFSLSLSLGSIHGASAAPNPIYSCTVKKWNSQRGNGLTCGIASLTMGETAETVFEDCKLKVYAGSAWGSRCHGLHIVMGTSASVRSGNNLKEQTSVFFCPESTPKEFQLSLLPKGSDAFDMDCTKSSHTKSSQ